jgi:hypothetical protein
VPWLPIPRTLFPWRRGSKAPKRPTAIGGKAVEVGEIDAVSGAVAVGDFKSASFWHMSWVS